MEFGSNYGAVEWTIENFSCWNKDLHNEVITSLNFFGDFYFKIYLTGGDYGHHMSVQLLRGDSRTKVSGNLSLIDSDKYVYCSAKVDIDDSPSSFCFELPSTPRFGDIVARSQMNEDLLMDQTTVRFQIREAVGTSVLRMRTVIRVHEFPVGIPGERMTNISLYDLSALCIRTIEYPSDDGTTEKVDLYAEVTYLKNIEFAIRPTGSRKKAFVSTRMYVIDKDGAVVRREVRESFALDKSLTFSNSLNKTEVEEKGFYPHFRFRIIPENKSELLCTYSSTTDQGQGLNLSAGSLSRSPSNKHVEKTSENTKADASNQPENSLTVLSKDLMCIYQDQDFSDLQLKCANVSFPVHKVILRGRSPVFKTMLSTDMTEAASNEVDIGDLDPSTLALFLTYLYTGAVEEMQSDRALNLYYAADKYQVPSLKRECAKFLCDNVSFSNVCDVLSLADRHRDEQLTSVAHDFVLKNYNRVLSSGEWDSLVKSDPLLVAKTVTHFAQKKYVGNINTA